MCWLADTPGSGACVCASRTHSSLCPCLSLSFSPPSFSLRSRSLPPLCSADPTLRASPTRCAVFAWSRICFPSILPSWAFVTCIHEAGLIFVFRAFVSGRRFRLATVLRKRAWVGMEILNFQETPILLSRDGGVGMALLCRLSDIMPHHLRGLD